MNFIFCCCILVTNVIVEEKVSCTTTSSTLETSCANQNNPVKNMEEEKQIKETEQKNVEKKRKLEEEIDEDKGEKKFKENVVVHENKDGKDGLKNENRDVDEQGGNDFEEDVNVKDEKEDDDSENEEKNVRNGTEFCSNNKLKDFTSEIHKIIVKGLPKYYGISEVRKHFEALTDVKICKVIPIKKYYPDKKTKFNQSSVFITFYNDDNRDIALTKLNGHKYKGRMLTAMKASAQPDPYLAKQNVPKTEEELKQIEINCSEDKLKNSTAPLWNVPYDKQLEMKMEQIKKNIDLMVFKIERLEPSLKSWFAAQREKFNGCPVELAEIRKTNHPEGYRNKCEFSIGLHPQTKEKTVGFRYGKYSQGSIYIGPIYDLIHIPDRMKDAVRVFEKYIRDSPRDIFDVVLHKGHWRQLTCRYGKEADELMITIGFDPQDLSTEELNEVRNELKDFFQNKEDGKKLRCTSVNFQLMPRRLPPRASAPRVELLCGEPTITQKLFDLSFEISPVSFFQVNNDACHSLYDSVAELAKLDKETTLMDICSGVGTIGLCLAKRCGEVLGVEFNANAVENAKQNALSNNLDNCEFYHGKAEHITSAVLSKAKHAKLVAVVDPPRAGIHHKLASTLRGSALQSIVYLACDVKSVMNNFNGLSSPSSKKFPKSPFVPTKVIPVDMFPYTHAVEWVVLLQRYDTLVKKE